MSTNAEVYERDLADACSPRALKRWMWQQRLFAAATAASSLPATLPTSITYCSSGLKRSS